MSVQFGGQCFADSAGAAAAFAAANVGAVYPAGSAVLTVTGAGATGATVTLDFLDLVSAATSQVVFAPTFAPCALLDWQDGLALGWGVATPWIIVACVAFLARGRKASA
jgi:hypothetical protein